MNARIIVINAFLKQWEILMFKRDYTIINDLESEIQVVKVD